MKRLILIVVLILASVQPLFADPCNVTQGMKYKRAKMNAALTCLNTNLAQAQADIADLLAEVTELKESLPPALAQAQADILDLVAEVTALKGLMPPADAVSMYEDDYVKIELTGAKKTVTDTVLRKATLALRLLITNKTTDTLYLARENDTSNVADENGVSCDRGLSGISSVYADNTNPYNYSVIGPSSSISASWPSSSCSYSNFYSAHYIQASFGFVRFDYSGNVRFNSGFSGIIVQ